MITDTLEEAIAAQNMHFENSKKAAYDNALESEKENLDRYYSVTTRMYDIHETEDGKFEYPEDGVYQGTYKTNQWEDV